MIPTVDNILGQAYSNYGTTFGGFKVFFVGGVRQLPPVWDKAIYDGGLLPFHSIKMLLYYKKSTDR